MKNQTINMTDLLELIQEGHDISEIIDSHPEAVDLFWNINLDEVK